MRVRLRRKSHPHHSRQARQRRGAEPLAPARSVRAVRPEDRVRRAGGPEDVATYSCECGYVFEAAVTASVACPHCRATQAW
jgi:hypothetical protein